MSTPPKKCAHDSPYEPTSLKDVFAADTSERYAALVRAMEEQYGIKIGEIPPPKENPYAVSPERGFETAVEAGIITRDGKLKYPFD